MSDHMGEPWGSTKDDEFGLHIVDSRGMHVSRKPDAIRRIVAAVNACAGIPTEELEKAGSIACEVQDEAQAELLKV